MQSNKTKESKNDQWIGTVPSSNSYLGSVLPLSWFLPFSVLKQNPLVLNSLAFLVHFSSVAQSCLTLCDPMNSSTPDLPVHHKLQEFTQTHAH